MIKPSEIIYELRRKLNISLKYEKELGLVKGGFKCDQWIKIGNYMGHECILKLYAKHIHSVDQIKNWVECYVIISFYPTESKGKPNDDGYSYHCKYKKCFERSYCTSDFEALLNKLFDAMSSHFDYNERFFSIKDEDEAMTLAFYKDLTWDSVSL